MSGQPAVTVSEKDGTAIAGFDEIATLMLRAAELGSAQRWDEALVCLDRAVAVNPWLPLARINRARVLAQLRRYAAALDDCDFFLRYVARLEPIEELRQQIFDDALRDLGARLAETPDDVKALFARGNLYLKSKLYAQALADYAAVLKRDASHVDALNNRGAALYAQDRYAEALVAYQAAVCLAPQRARLWFNLGNVWQALGRLDEARAVYRQAIALAPQFAEAHLESAHCDLSAGDFERGWSEFEWRWRTDQMRAWRMPSQAPLWLGGERPAAVAGRTLAAPALAGRTLLLWAEQGAGDTLQCVRFVARLAAATASNEPAVQLVLRVPAALRRLLARLDARVEVIADDGEPPPHDAHCPLMSLPLALGVGADVGAPPYLRADADEVARWRQRLGAGDALRGGLVWAGRQFGQTNLTRDIALQTLAPLAALNVDWVCLQKEVPPADAAALAAWPRLRVFSETLGDYADTAALIMNLDLTIAVDTSVAHLAGALGKPCWLLLRHSGEWRWQRGRADSAWYPTLRLFRQSVPGDWDELVARVAVALARQIEEARR